jgi:hypothetical protein
MGYLMKWSVLPLKFQREKEARRGISHEMARDAMGWTGVADLPVESGWYALADQAVDGFADEVGVAGVSRVLLDHVDEDVAQTR